MKIDSKSIYHDVPLIKVRDFLRKNREGFSEESFFRSFDEKKGSGKRILGALTNDGYLEKGRVFPQEYDLTPRGQQLASATATRKVKRATVVKALHKLLDRVADINEGPDYLFRVTDIKVFGSYLFERGEVDLLNSRA